MTVNASFRNTIRLFFNVGIMLVLTANASAEWKEKVLYSFQGGSDGYTPAGGVVFDKAGNLYGANSWGGSGGCTSPGCGTVFEISPPLQEGGAWTKTTIYAFQGVSGAVKDGLTPEGGLIIDEQGNLYGTTSLGGSGPCILLGSPAGCGVVYELSPPTQKGGQWAETILYSFQGGNDGYFPVGDLVFDKHGNLYGSTWYGGGQGNNCDLYYGGNCGIVFKLSPPKQKDKPWTEKVLCSFAGVANGQQVGDGADPNGGLVLDSKGAVYGTTYYGGIASGECGKVGCGTVFRLSPPTMKGGAWKKDALHRFNGQDGATPAAGVIFGRDGKLYGTVSAGATDANGAVFDLAARKGNGVPWKETVLYRFSDGNDGTSPEGALVFDAKGYLYGTALGGGSHLGVVFRLKPPKHGSSRSITSVYDFTGPPDGSHPRANLILDGLGNLYSATQSGGTGTDCPYGGCGSVFEAIR
jgi:hypothetical protein